MYEEKDNKKLGSGLDKCESSTVSIEATTHKQPRNMRSIASQCSLDKIDLDLIAQTSTHNDSSRNIQSEILETIEDKEKPASTIAALFYAIGQDDRPHVTVMVKGRPVTALVDTGAGGTVIGNNHVSEVSQWGDKLDPYPIPLLMADQSCQNPVGQIEVEYTLDGLTRKVPTIVLNAPTSTLILGTDFLKLFHIGIFNSRNDVYMFNAAGKERERKPSRDEQNSLLDMIRRTLQQNLEESMNEHDVEREQSVCEKVEKISVMRKTYCENDENDYEPLTAEKFIEWRNFQEDHDQREIAHIEFEPDLPDGILSQQKMLDQEAIHHNRLATSEDHNDTEQDIEAPKISPVTVPHTLTEAQKEMLDSVLTLFSSTNVDGELSMTNAIEHIIDTGDAKPIMRRQYPMSPIQLEKVQKELDKMTASGIITEIKYSPWRSPILAVKKKDGGVRVCLDARELNKVTIPNAYPITDTNSIVAQLKTTKYMSSIDLSQAFHQVPLEKTSQEKTAFTIGNKMLCYKRMTMGLRNSPATLAILIDQIFRDLHPYAFSYVDDFIICSETFEHHIQLLTTIAHRLAKFGLTISPNKSHFCCKQLEFLGYILTEDGLSANLARTAAIRQFPRPTSVKEVRRLLGAAGWYRRFIPGFAEICAPITALLSKNKKSIVWTEEAEQSFTQLKEKLASPPVLAMCDYSRPFKLFCDASDVAGAAVLTQDFEEGNKPLCYYSFKFSDVQQRYTATERECLAVIAAVEKFRPYIEGYKFEVITDHAALQWLMDIKDRKGRLARWAIRLQAYTGDMSFTHRQGKRMELPDALSRTIGEISTNASTSTDPWIDRIITRLKDEKDKVHEKYKYENGQLYHRNAFSPYASDRLWVPCIPTDQRTSMLIAQHDEYSHLGIWKTIRRMKRLCYWPNMFDDVHSHIRKCVICRCAKSSNENTTSPIGQFRDPKMTGRMLSIDLMGEYPLSKFGNRYIFVVIDCFSKYIWTKTMRSQTAQGVIAFLENTVFATNGCPQTIISDNGTQFKCKLFAEMCRRRKITHHLTPRNHPKANPVESTNKSIKIALRTYLSDKPEHTPWENYLSKIVNDLNSTPHSTTQITPQFLQYGRELVRYGDEYTKLVDANEAHANDSDRKELIEEETHDFAADVYEGRREKLNRKAKKRSFNVNDVVYIPKMKLSDKGAKYNRKLAPAKVAAHVKEKIGSDTYLLTDMKGNDLGKIHADDMFVYSISRKRFE